MTTNLARIGLTVIVLATTAFGMGAAGAGAEAASVDAGDDPGAHAVIDAVPVGPHPPEPGPILADGQGDTAVAAIDPVPVGPHPPEPLPRERTAVSGAVPGEA
ncbi:MAG: hypothetical protein ABEH56_06960 [Salinirussus sp.]